MTNENKHYVCIRCRGFKGACEFTKPDGAMLPVMCGPDQCGYMIGCDWQEVPEEKTWSNSTAMHTL